MLPIDFTFAYRCGTRTMSDRTWACTDARHEPSLTFHRTACVCRSRAQTWPLDEANISGSVSDQRVVRHGPKVTIHRAAGPNAVSSALCRNDVISEYDMFQEGASGCCRSIALTTTSALPIQSVLDGMAGLPDAHVSSESANPASVSSGAPTAQASAHVVDGVNRACYPIRQERGA